MKILILYASNHGCTEKCVVELAALFENHNVTTAKLQATTYDLTDFDTVIIGSPVRIGRINKKISKFCRKNLTKLLKKNIGLFLCCMNTENTARAYMSSQFPKKLQHKAVALGYFGGALTFDKMTSLEKSLLKQVIGCEHDASFIDRNAISHFAAVFKSSFNKNTAEKGK
jgi:menaquinone-dependent protoporphyrinogen oxidase